MIKVVNGEILELTPDEIAFREADIARGKAKDMGKYLDKYHDNRLNGGVTIGGFFIKSNETSRGLINGAVTRAIIDNDLNKSYDFFAPDGSVVPLTNAQFMSIGLGLAKHAQDCLYARASISGQTFNSIEELEQAYEAAYAAA